MKRISTLFVVISFAISTYGQRALGVGPSETGGPLMFEQAVFDVQNYDISISADRRSKSITGVTVVTARTVIPTNVIILDLDRPYTPR